MNTPIADFIRTTPRAIPSVCICRGTKGRELLGCEALDITEIPGADELYVADGIIGESEQKCRRAVRHRCHAVLHGGLQSVHPGYGVPGGAERPRRTRAESVYPCHPQRAQDFSLCAGSTDSDVRWLVSAETDSLCACRITATDVAPRFT